MEAHKNPPKLCTCKQFSTNGVCEHTATNYPAHTTDQPCCPKCIIELDYKPSQCNNGECECHIPKTRLSEGHNPVGVGEPQGDWEREILQAAFDLGKVTANEVRQYFFPVIRALLYKREEEVLGLIAKDQGWEDSRDYFAAKLGLPYKYTDRFHKPSKGEVE